MAGDKKAKLRVFVKAERDFTSGYCSTGSNKSQAVQEIFLQGKAWLLEVSRWDVGSIGSSLNMQDKEVAGSKSSLE